MKIGGQVLDNLNTVVPLENHIQCSLTFAFGWSLRITISLYALNVGEPKNVNGRTAFEDLQTAPLRCDELFKEGLCGTES